MKRIIVGIGSAVTIFVAGSGASLPDARVSATNVHAASSTACATTPIQTKPFPGGLRDLRWIAATPLPTGVTGHLFYGHNAHGTTAEMHIHGTMPDSGATKILWVISHGNVGRTITIAGRNLTGPGRTKQVFPDASGGGVPGSQYPSIVVVPTPGCWQFHLRSGSVTGTVTLHVVK